MLKSAPGAYRWLANDSAIWAQAELQFWGPSIAPRVRDPFGGPGPADNRSVSSCIIAFELAASRGLPGRRHGPRRAVRRRSCAKISTSSAPRACL